MLCKTYALVDFRLRYGGRTYVNTLFSVKSVNAVMAVTQVPVPLPCGSSWVKNAWLAQKPPFPITVDVSFEKKYPQHWNYK